MAVKWPEDINQPYYPVLNLVNVDIRCSCMELKGNLNANLEKDVNVFVKTIRRHLVDVEVR